MSSPFQNPPSMTRSLMGIGMPPLSIRLEPRVLLKMRFRLSGEQMTLDTFVVPGTSCMCTSSSVRMNKRGGSPPFAAITATWRPSGAT